MYLIKMNETDKRNFHFLKHRQSKEYKDHLGNSNRWNEFPSSLENKIPL